MVFRRRKRSRIITEPRLHHYTFVHRLLPALFYGDPTRFVNSLAGGKSDFLRFLWERVGEREVKAKSKRIPATGLDCEIRELEDGTFVGLIVLPEPEGLTEAYFVAVVYWPFREKLFSEQAAIARFITLEYGWDYEKGVPRTVLCEWEPDRRHSNRGNGPEPTLGAFFETVCRLVDSEATKGAESS
jgi:hypothetical protein